MVKRPVYPSDDSESDQASKRARTEDLSENDSDDERGTQSQRKRKGKGKAKANGRSDYDDGESSEEDAETVIPANPLNDEEFEELNREKIHKRLNEKRGVQKGIAEYGIIEAIEMLDFMCHKRLSFTFGPQINFIIGHNGSGKSAVLSALTIALGGKTNSTGRGTGLKSFIREGQGWAQVTIQIKNQGEDAFKKELYGKSIIIVRRFTKEGSSTWKIQSAEGKVVSTKREELSAICDHMNIQVDNPMNVLTQDASRQFLSASGPSEKYKFFLLGTQLFQLSTEYDICHQNIEKTAKVLAHKYSAIPDLKQRYKLAFAQFKEAEKAREQKKKVDDLKKELAWSHVDAKRMEMEKDVEELARLKKRLPKIEDSIARAETEVDEETARIEELEAQVTELGDQERLTQEKKTIQDEMRENRTKIASYSSDIRGIQTSLKTVNTQIEDLEAEIEKENLRMAAHSQARQEELDRRVQEAQAQVTAAEQKHKDIVLGRQELQAQIETALAAGKAIEKEQSVIEEDIMKCQSIIEKARQAANDAYVPYGNRIQIVLQKMKTLRWHGDMPVGPLGMHVKARDPQTWGPLLRHQLGGYLAAFAITDARDRPQLKRLLDESKNRNTIIIAQRDLFEYSHGEPDPRYLTVLRALEISDPWVTRILINQANIERVVLAKTRKEVETQLKELKGGVGWSHDEFFVRVYPEGGVSSNPLRIGRNNSLLLTGRDNASEISHHEAEKRQLEQKYQELGQEITQHKQEYFQKRAACENLKRTEQQAFNDVKQCKANLSTLQQEINDVLPTTITGFKDAKEEASQEKATLLLQFEEVERKRTEVGRANNDLQLKIDDLKKQIEDFQAKKTEFTNKIADTAADRAEKQNNVKYYKEKLEQERKGIAAKEKTVDKCQTEFKNWTASALQYCEEVPNPRSTEEVDRELNSVLNALKEREKRDGRSVEDMALEFTKAKEAFEKANQDYKQMSTLNKALKRSLSDRMHRWHEFRRHIALRTKLIFQYHLSQRGYFGKVMFNHDAQTLNLRVQTDDQVTAEQGNAEKDPRSLSGGEKSFSTICLLLSLWDSIGCPLRCLDEFDVFMDAVNRRISMKMMIETATASPDKQYILITPQDMTNIHIGENVKVHRMLDPERTGGRLRFGAGPSNE